MVKRNLSARSYIPAIVIVLTLLLILLLCEDMSSSQIDTLDLYLQWAYPINITAMELVDFDQDGINEIIVGFNTDSAHVGILDAATQSVLWESPGIMDHIGAVAAGDRNDDGSLDIICGGHSSDPEEGFVQIFDGPSFHPADTIWGLDNSVTAIRLHVPCPDSGSELLIGTDWLESFWDGWYSKGHLFRFCSETVAPRETVTCGVVRRIETNDIDSDGSEDIVYSDLYMSENEAEQTYYGRMTIATRVCFAESTLVITVFDDWGLDYYPRGELDAMAVGDSDQDDTLEVLVAYHYWYTHYPKLLRWRLRSFNFATSETEWMTTSDSNLVTSLAKCDYLGSITPRICVAYHDGFMKIKSGADGGDIAVSAQLPLINHFALGNVDHDDLIELCIASDESLYVYETPSITTDVEEPEHPSRPEDFHLCQNYPNPFNPETTIRFTIPVRAKVCLEIFNILGEQVKGFERYYMPGTYSIIWDGKNSSGEDVSSGIYLYRLTAGDIKETKKMVLLR